MTLLLSAHLRHGPRANDDEPVIWQSPICAMLAGTMHSFWLGRAGVVGCCDPA